MFRINVMPISGVLLAYIETLICTLWGDEDDECLHKIYGDDFTKKSVNLTVKILNNKICFTSTIPLLFMEFIIQKNNKNPTTNFNAEIIMCVRHVFEFAYFADTDVCCSRYIGYTLYLYINIYTIVTKRHRKFMYVVSHNSIHIRTHKVHVVKPN